MNWEIYELSGRSAMLWWTSLLGCDCGVYGGWGLLQSKLRCEPRRRGGLRRAREANRRRRTNSHRRFSCTEKMFCSFSPSWSQKRRGGVLRSLSLNRQTAQVACGSTTNQTRLATRLSPSKQPKVLDHQRPYRLFKQPLCLVRILNRFSRFLNRKVDTENQICVLGG